jgi:hypothetical protein
MKTWPGGMSLVLEATAWKGVQVIAVGYKYYSSKIFALLLQKIQGQHYPESLTKQGLLMTSKVFFPDLLINQK